MKPNYVKFPAGMSDKYHLLSYVQPDIKGHTPGAGIFEGSHAEAVAYCESEALHRGIRKVEYHATIESSMFNITFEKALENSLVG